MAKNKTNSAKVFFLTGIDAIIGRTSSQENLLMSPDNLDEFVNIVRIGDPKKGFNPKELSENFKLHLKNFSREEVVDVIICAHGYYTNIVKLLDKFEIATHLNENVVAKRLSDLFNFLPQNSGVKDVIDDLNYSKINAEDLFKYLNDAVDGRKLNILFNSCQSGAMLDKVTYLAKGSQIISFTTKDLPVNLIPLQNINSKSILASAFKDDFSLSKLASVIIANNKFFNDTKNEHKMYNNKLYISIHTDEGKAQIIKPKKLLDTKDFNFAETAKKSKILQKFLEDKIVSEVQKEKLVSNIDNTIKGLKIKKADLSFFDFKKEQWIDGAQQLFLNIKEFDEFLENVFGKKHTHSDIPDQLKKYIEVHEESIKSEINLDMISRKEFAPQLLPTLEYIHNTQLSKEDLSCLNSLLSLYLSSHDDNIFFNHINNYGISKAILCEAAFEMIEQNVDLSGITLNTDEW